MKTYIGVKRIQAEPQERNGKPGYRVIYEPDGYEKLVAQGCVRDGISTY